MESEGVDIRLEILVRGELRASLGGTVGAEEGSWFGLMKALFEEGWVGTSTWEGRGLMGE